MSAFVLKVYRFSNQERAKSSLEVYLKIEAICQRTPYGEYTDVVIIKEISGQFQAPKTARIRQNFVKNERIELLRISL